MDINFGVVVRLERKFRPPKLVRAAACRLVRVRVPRSAR